MDLMIERVFIAVLLLSISGFIFCAIFLPFERYAYKFTSASTMVTANTIALFSFVVPFYFIISLKDKSESLFVNYDLLVFENASKYGEIVSNIKKWGIVEYLGMLWLLGVIAFIVSYVWRYIYFRNHIRKNLFDIDDDIWYIKFCKKKSENKLSNVKLMGCCYLFTPCTIGIKNKKIIIPSYMFHAFDENEIEFILQHEFYHVMHKDLLRESLVTILNCFNWFNLLYYFLRSSLSYWIEVACDEEVTKNFDKAQRFKYCQLLLKVLEMENNRNKGNLFSMNFIGLKMKNYKKRITKVMRKNELNGIKGKVAVALVLVFAITSGNVIAKAADAPINMMFSKNVEVVKTEQIEVLEEQPDFNEIHLFHDKHTSDRFIEFQMCNTENITYEIMDYNGNTEFTSKGYEQIEPKHAHKIANVTIKEHKKHNDASCTTTYYEGKKCTICSIVWKGDKIGDTTMVKCNH